MFMRLNNGMTKIAADPRVAAAETDEDGHWVYLRHGYGYDSSHTIHETSVSAVKAAMKHVYICTCDECKKEGQ